MKSNRLIGSVKIKLIILFSAISSFYSCGESHEMSIGNIYFPEGKHVDTLLFNYGTFKDIRVDVIQDSSQYRYIFDTGSQYTIVSRGGTIFENNKSTITDVSGRVFDSEIVLVDSMQLGDIKILNFITHRKILNGADGIIGGNLAMKFAWKIDFIHQRIEIAPNASVFNLTQNPLPLKIVRGCPKVEVRVDNKKDWFLIDTGYTGFVQAKKDSLTFFRDTSGRWNTLGYSPNYNIFGTDTVEQTFYSKMKLSNIELGEISFNDEIIAYDINRQKNLLGLDFLRRFSYVVFDYPGKKLYLGEKLYKSFDYLELIRLFYNALGIRLSIYENQYVRIASIVPELLSNEIELGDTVMEINEVLIYQRDESFYRDSLIKGEGFVRLQQSQLREIVANYNYSLDSATIKIKKGHTCKNIALKRMKHPINIPDTIHRFNIPLHLPPIFKKGVKQQKNNGFYYIFTTRDEFK